MTTLVQKVRAFLSGPQGRRMVSEGKRQLAKPENQHKLRQFVDRLRNRRR
jgi:hypothetical protein